MIKIEKRIGSDISEKNNKKKYIFRQGRMDCCLQTCEISENEACGFYQKYVGSSDVERLSCGRSVPSVQKVNHIGTNLDMIIKTAEKQTPNILKS